MAGAPAGTRTRINGLGNRGSILLNYGDVSVVEVSWITHLVPISSMKHS